MKSVKKFCKKFGVKAKPDVDFQAIIETNRIGYNFGQDNLDEFYDYILNMYPDIKASIWTWALLHEIGHLKTKQYIVKGLSYYIHQKIDRMEIPTKMHHYDPDEVIATHWAAKYIKNHKKEIKKFEKKLRANLGEKIWNMYVDTE